ncbi:MAG: hypothetical protein WD766_08695 [Gemmatimonadota bacterium]
MHREFRVLAGAAALVALTAGSAVAQVPSTPKEMGMGGAYMGVARGYEAVFLAPGNLGLADGPRWSIAFPQVAVGGTLVGPEFTDIPDLIDFTDIPETRQDELLGLVPPEGTAGQFSLRAPLLAITNGGLAIGAGYAAVGQHTLSRDLAELLLNGYEDGRTDYSVGDTFGERASYWDFTLGYGREVLPGLSVGATGHYLRGRTIVRSRLFEPRVLLEEQDVEVDYVGVLSRGGTGYALDVGAAYLPHPDVTLSFALSNAIAQMTWSEELYSRSLTINSDLLDNLSPVDLVNRYEASEQRLDPSSTSLRVIGAAQGLYENAVPPAVSRFGVAWKPFFRTHVAADFHKKVTDGRLGDAWDQRFSVGLQQQLPIISVRAGYAGANDGGNMLSGGLSIGPLDLGVARYQHSDIDDTRTRGWIATFGLGVEQTF